MCRQHLQRQRNENANEPRVTRNGHAVDVVVSHIINSVRRRRPRKSASKKAQRVVEVTIHGVSGCCSSRREHRIIATTPTPTPTPTPRSSTRFGSIVDVVVVVVVTIVLAPVKAHQPARSGVQEVPQAAVVCVLKQLVALPKQRATCMLMMRSTQGMAMQATQRRDATRPASLTRERHLARGNEPVRGCCRIRHLAGRLSRCRLHLRTKTRPAKPCGDEGEADAPVAAAASCASDAAPPLSSACCNNHKREQRRRHAHATTCWLPVLVLR